MALGAAAYLMWGLFPLYFPLLEPAEWNEHPHHSHPALNVAAACHPGADELWRRLGIEDGQKGVKFPAGATPNCGTIATTGTFGYKWTA